jgi:hypothetical protein
MGVGNGNNVRLSSFPLRFALQEKKNQLKNELQAELPQGFLSAFANPASER